MRSLFLPRRRRGTTRSRWVGSALVAALIGSVAAVGLGQVVAGPAAAADVTTPVDDATTSGANSFTYDGNWIGDAGLPADRWFAGTEHYSLTAGASVTLGFTGTSAQVFGAKHPGHGIYSVSVDGGTPTLFDAYATPVAYQQLIIDTGVLPLGEHTVTITLTGEKNPSSTGIAGQIDYASVTGPAPVSTTAWTALPQPTTMNLTGGAWAPTPATRIFLLRDQQSALQHEAERLSSELATAGALETAPGIVVGTEAQIAVGDIVLRTGDVPAVSSPEGFSISTSDRVQIVGESAAGVFYATRQILQNLAATSSVPLGSVSSEPAVGERSLHIDIARKFYSAEWIEQQIRDMSYVGLNTVQLHFSENEGFRIESEMYPQIVSEQHLTKAEVREIIALANDLHVQVVPSLDMPGHLTKVLDNFPQFELKDASGAVVHGALDITNPEAVAFAKTLIDEYAELFSGSTYWNLGADEFVNFEQMANYPALQEAAQARYGDGATGFDLLTAFANDIGAYVQTKGFTPRVWNDGMLRSTFVTLDTDIQITWWTNWSPQMALLQTAVDGGYDLVNFNDSLFYYVLGENAGYTYPTAAKIWDRNWQPGVFPTWQGGIQTLVQPYPDQLLGASFAIWSDRPDAQTQEQVAAGIRSPLRAMAERSWNAGSTINLTQFSGTDLLIGRAPGIEEALVPSGTVTVLADPTGPTDPTTPTDPTDPTDPSGPVTPGNPTAGSSNDGSQADRDLASTGAGAVWLFLLTGVGLLVIGGTIVFRKRSYLSQ